MKVPMFPILSFLLIIFSCSKSEEVLTPIIKNPDIESLPITVNKALLLELVNGIRKKGCQCGDTYHAPVAALTWNTQLELAAYKHSKEMYENKYFSHIAKDGSNGGVRIERAGYNWMAYAENIGTGYINENQVFTAWINSPGHCKNIMGKAYKEMGVARVGTYWTQDFGTR
jgi:uncharacterized protein YkwD